MLSFKTIADKYNLDEDEIEDLFMYYDTNDFIHFKRQLGYLMFLLSESQYIGFITDLFRYVHQCSPQ